MATAGGAEESALVSQVVEEPLPGGGNAGTTAAKGAVEEGAAKGGSEPATLAVEGLVVQSVATDGVEKEQNQQVVVVKEVIPLHLEIAIPSNPFPEAIYRSALKGPQPQQEPESEPAPEPALKPQPQLQPQPQPLAILPADNPEPAVSGGAVVGATAEDAATEPMPEIVVPEMDPLGPMGKILRPAGWAVAVGAGVLSLVGVVVGVGKLKGWLEKRKRLAKGKKEGEQKARRRRHVRDWRVSGE